MYPNFLGSMPWRGEGVEGWVGVEDVHLWHGSRAKSDVQWAKKWRTVGQNLTYAGLKSGIQVKLQYWSILINDIISVLWCSVDLPLGYI